MTAPASVPLDFGRRSPALELMDTEECGVAEFEACLVDLAKVNRVTNAYRPTFLWLDRLVRDRRPTEPLRIVDCGSGYGDMLRKIDRWAVRRGIAVELTGIDLNPWSRAAALKATAPDWPIRWITTDLFEYRPDQPVDIVISSLFTHHLTDDQVVRFVRWMETTSRVGWFVNDLHRHPLPYHVFRLWSKLAGWHRFVQNDGPISITRAFVAADWRRLLARAEVPADAADVAWHVPFRLCVGRRK
ncbi:MAG TPA: methyltransferase domain-containing protein [Aliidongia sp.]|uniref:methyltransferase domain-containing protein n=1 Tax=Aliidongia sp. TaxID=1914230 RepID=UPI002DDDA6B6|nr:methyltransferase domain-containing protein [Aliidongia sp.]HEV2675257.1 methyltransferase domain-containing protein [Aliidongia sp.]